MYSKEEAKEKKKKFWIAFGKYMALQPSASQNKINWINYNTGVKDLYFRTNANQKSAQIYIEMVQTDLGIQELMYEQFIEYKHLLHNYLNEEWEWTPKQYNNNGKLISSIGTTLPHVNIFKEDDWQAIINFFQPRLIALDEFWTDCKDAFTLFN